LKKYHNKPIQIALKQFAHNCMCSYHIHTSELNSKQNLTQKKSIEILSMMIKELLGRNYNQETYKQDFYFKKPILVPLSPNYYSENSDNFWETFEQYSLTQIKLALKIAEYFNIFVIRKGYWSKKEITIFNILTSNYDSHDYIDSEMTTVYLNPPELWKKDKIFNKIKHPKENKEYTWKDIFYMFSPDVHETKWEAVNRRKWIDENGEQHKEDKKAFLYLNKQVSKINKILKKSGYGNWTYKRIFGEKNNQFGRFYSSFQMLPKKYRELILKEEGLIEKDFSASNPNIIYLLETGKEFDGDIYNEFCNKLGIPIEYRPILKAILLPLFACASKNGLKGAIVSIRQVLSKSGTYNDQYQPPTLIENTKKYLDEKSLIENEKKKNSKKFKPKNYYKNKIHCFKKYCSKNNITDVKHYLINPDNLLDQIEQLFPIFKPYLYSNNSALLQNIESEICYATMLNQIALNENPLSIHDCFIVSKKNKDIIDYKMKFNRFIILLKYTKEYFILYKELFYFILKNKNLQTILNPIKIRVMKIGRSIEIIDEIAMAPT